MKGLFLYGIKCQPWIWNDVKKDFEDYEIDYVEYPIEITKRCDSVNDFSQWVYETYLSNNQDYDFILGHSMGGLIALQLSARNSIHFKKTILVESFLTTIEPVYQNLMTDSHIETMGDRVFDMLKKEDGNYTNSLKASLREDEDYSHYIECISESIYGIYGDRNNTDRTFLIDSLKLKKSYLSRIHLSFIHNSCHLPMLENPTELIQSIRSILKQD